MKHADFRIIPHDRFHKMNQCPGGKSPDTGVADEGRYVFAMGDGWVLR